MRNIFPISSKKFGDRLEALMTINNISSSFDLAIKLLGYKSKPKSATQEYIDCLNRARSINNHLKLDILSEPYSTKGISSSFLADYCNYFKCSADYFFGYIDYPTHEYTNISKKTGLNIAAIDTLKKLHNPNGLGLINILNYIMNDYFSFSVFLHNLSLYFHNDYDTPVHFDNKKGIFVKTPTMNSPILKHDEPYIYIGKETKNSTTANPFYETIGVPVSILKSHALHSIEKIIDIWQEKYIKERDNE